MSGIFWDVSLTSGAGVLFLYLWLAVLLSLLNYFLLFSLLFLCRREWLAAGLWLAIMVLLQAFVPSDYLWFTVCMLVARMAVDLIVLLRYGLLALTVSRLFYHLLTELPITGDLSAWYAGTSLAAMLLMAGLAVYGFVVSLGGRPLLGKALLGKD